MKTLTEQQGSLAVMKVCAAPAEGEAGPPSQHWSEAVSVWCRASRSGAWRGRVHRAVSGGRVSGTRTWHSAGREGRCGGEGKGGGRAGGDQNVATDGRK